MKHIQYVPQYQRDTLNQRKTVLSTLLEPLKNYKFDKQSYTSRIEAVLRHASYHKAYSIKAFRR